MGRGVGRDRGGIAGLVELLAEHGEAVEYDLLTMGKRLADLGSVALTWRDLLIIVRQSPPQSALARSRYGDAVAWGATEHLLALIADHLAGANWQRSGGKGTRPTPIKRPGAKSERKSLGSGAIPISDFDAWWNEGAATDN